jgi:hypothetical protein
MSIRTRAELDEALRRVLVDAIADEAPEDETDRSNPRLAPVAPRDRRVAELEWLLRRGRRPLSEAAR